MSTHIGAAVGDVAPLVLMPGDPLRARWIAETFLDDAACYSEVRGMYGFTGTWRGHRVSVQGSGMGQPSLAIYATELFREYDVQSVIRVGSCGALTEELALRDLVIASGACTDSSMNKITFEGLDYAPVADFGLLRDAAAAAPEAYVGLILSGDSFYPTRPELDDAAGGARRAGDRDGGERPLHDRGPSPPQGAGDLHGLRPHRHWRGDDVAGARADVRADGRGGADRRD